MPNRHASQGQTRSTVRPSPSAAAEQPSPLTVAVFPSPSQAIAREPSPVTVAALPFPLPALTRVRAISGHYRSVAIPAAGACGRVVAGDDYGVAVASGSVRN